MQFGEAHAEILPGSPTDVAVFIVRGELPVESEPSIGSRLGATFRFVTLNSEAALIFEDVVSGHAASNAGLKNGDVLLTVDGVSALGERVLAAKRYLELRSANNKVIVSVRRSDDIITATIAAAPASESQ
jgi:S1-C subfamily serine protease